MSSRVDEAAPVASDSPPVTPAPAKPAANKKRAPTSQGKRVVKKTTKKRKGPGKYSQLVIDTLNGLGERGGSSLVRIYKEARKVSWFDQEHGRVYLRSSIRALLMNDTLVQVKGLGANGSFRLNKKKVETKKPSANARKSVKATKKSPAKTREKKTGVRKATTVKKPSKAKKAAKKANTPAAAAKKKNVTKITKTKQMN